MHDAATGKSGLAGYVDPLSCCCVAELEQQGVWSVAADTD